MRSAARTSVPNSLVSIVSGQCGDGKRVNSMALAIRAASSDLDLAPMRSITNSFELST